MTIQRVVTLDAVRIGDVGTVGGKNASLGEMITKLASAGVLVPGGFATTADAYREFLSTSGLDARIRLRLDDLDTNDVIGLAAAGREIRRWVIETPLSEGLVTDLTSAWETMEAATDGDLAVAVRSSATAEDLPEASFAGQQETFLNVRGLDALFEAVHRVFASLYNDRAISYRVHHGFEHHEVALSAGIQKMVRSASSGVAFTIDTESGFSDAVFITSIYGLGELIVQGEVNPDEFYVYKPAIGAGRPALLSKTIGAKQREMLYADDGVRTQEVDSARRRRFSLSDEDVTALAAQAVAIEQHYGQPMDIEWAKDADDGLIYIVQARPETVQSRSGRVLERFRIKATVEALVTGRSVGQRVGQGRVRVVRSPAEMHTVEEGDVLVADMTDPDWEPIMKRASAIVTNRGGRTCHAAIIARELEIPAVVGSGNATDVLESGTDVTVSCAEGDTGFVYPGLVDYDVQRIELDSMPPIDTKIMMNVASPDRAFSFARLPNAGVGLARVEFVINNVIGIHPKALIDYEDLPTELRTEIDSRIAGYPDPQTFFVEKLREGVATIAAAFHPKPVIVRMSDFKSNEYAHLVGGDRYEPTEENPMIGFRGAARYTDPSFAESFALECRALRMVREDMGLENVKLMIPFVRTLDEARGVIEVLEQHGIERGVHGLELIMMCELPSNAVLAEQFLDYFDGFSIGSNDLTQLTLGLDRDSGLVAKAFNERDPAVLALMDMAIKACQKSGKYIGICGQGPSDHPGLARWLMDRNIESMSLNPDTVLEMWLFLANEVPA
ncbi:MAG: phosphoenolpyruvate synthase [Acidimicrobiia bacterium]|nr:phosphoenolpyruvate synthase [Acidimicrobiia bacterium]